MLRMGVHLQKCTKFHDAHKYCFRIKTLKCSNARQGDIQSQGQFTYKRKNSFPRPQHCNSEVVKGSQRGCRSYFADRNTNLAIVCHLSIIEKAINCTNFIEKCIYIEQ